jgi:Neprosin
MKSSWRVFTIAGLCLGAAVATLPMRAAAQATSNQDTRAFECRERPRDLAEPPRRDPAVPKDFRGKETTVEAGSAVEAKPLCPDGQLPFPREFRGPKGNPFFSGTSVDAPYQYAGAWASAGGSIPLFDGGGVVTRVENPAMSRAAGTHSLFEISVQGGTGNGNIVEIGWIKNVGDASPRLFVFHWVGWVPACYNGCGWVQWNPSIVPGMVVNIGSESYMGWVYYQGNWWAWYANQWVGYFPGTLWRGDYSKSSLVQWFGEIYESDPTPESDMGNGRLAVHAAAARLWYPCTVDAAAWVCWIHPTPSLNAPSIPWYTIQNVGGSAHRYGGPGGRAGAGLDP